MCQLSLPEAGRWGHSRLLACPGVSADGGKEGGAAGAAAGGEDEKEDGEAPMEEEGEGALPHCLAPFPSVKEMVYAFLQGSPCASVHIAASQCSPQQPCTAACPSCPCALPLPLPQLQLGALPSELLQTPNPASAAATRTGEVPGEAVNGAALAAVPADARWPELEKQVCSLPPVVFISVQSSSLSASFRLLMLPGRTAASCPGAALHGRCEGGPHPIDTFFLPCRRIHYFLVARTLYSPSLPAAHSWASGSWPAACI